MPQEVQPTPKWKIPLALGIVLPFLFWFVLRIVNPPVDANTQRIAKVLGADPSTLREVWQLGEKAENKGEISSKEWQRLNALSRTAPLRYEAVAVMMKMPKSSHRQDILTTVYPRLQSKEGVLQAQALILLWRFKDPRWHTEALSRRNHPDKDVRTIARTILSKGDRKK